MSKNYSSCNTLAVTLLVAAALSVPAGLKAQSTLILNEYPAETASSLNVGGVLPDAPSSSLGDGSASPQTTAAGKTQLMPAGRYAKYIAPGQPAQKLDARDKFILGLKDAISPFSLVAWIINAGYEQALNGSPNYGTNRVAFAQRFGAAAARDVSQGLFGDSILAPILREDPRYYRVGSSHNVLYRLVYAGTRPLITRTDGGHKTINLANLGGNLGGAVLTNAYYPPLNRGFNQTMQTFGGSVGGSALGFVVSEFLTGSLQSLHLVSSPR